MPPREQGRTKALTWKERVERSGSFLGRGPAMAWELCRKELGKGLGSLPWPLQSAVHLLLPLPLDSGKRKPGYRSSCKRSASNGLKHGLRLKSRRRWAWGLLLGKGPRLNSGAWKSQWSAAEPGSPTPLQMLLQGSWAPKSKAGTEHVSHSWAYCPLRATLAFLPAPLHTFLVSD